MSMKITAVFKNGKTLDIPCSTINFSRNKERRVDANITNITGDFALNTAYDEIIKLQGDDDSFTIVFESAEGGKVEFDNIALDYYNSGQQEILHLSTKHEAVC